MTRLYITGEEVELEKELQFSITKQFEDLDNPTTIINDWSKTIEIPMSKRNNEIFGYAFNIDKKAFTDTNILSINPTASADFRLDMGDDVVMQGYMKLDSITNRNGNSTYNCTLYGELGNVLNKMRKITFGNTDDINYKIYGADYFYQPLNRFTVAEGFESLQESLELKNTTEEGYKWTDIVAFAPSNSYKSLFDYTQYIKSNNEIVKFTEDIDSRTYGGQSFKDITGLSSENILSDGKLKPRDYGEFRSWLQLPYIYFNKLFQIFNVMTEKTTGYNVILDDKWFNKNNAYWKYLVMMLNTVEDAKDVISSSVVPTFEFLPSEVGTYKRYIAVNKGQLRDLPDTPISFTVELHTPMDIPEGAIVSLSSTGKITLLAGEYGWVAASQFGSNEQFTYDRAGSSGTSFLDMRYNGGGNYITSITAPYTFDFFYNTNFDEISLFITCALEAGENNSPFAYYLNGVEYPIQFTTVNFGKLEYNGVRQLGSGIKVSLNDLWSTDVNIFDVILNYCKLFRIGLFIDDKNKTITYRPLRDYFREYTIEDWTDKVDMSRDFKVEYLITDNKYMLFNKKESKCELNEQYKQKVGINYGDFKFDTGYKFGDSTKNIFDNPIPSGIEYSPYRLDYDKLIGLYTPTGRPVINYYIPNEAYVSDFSSDNKHSSVFGQLFFVIRFGFDLKEGSSGQVLNPVYITDDFPISKQLDKTCYNERGYYSIPIDRYHGLVSIYNGAQFQIQEGYSVNIGAERSSFTKRVITEKSLYNIFWDNYMNERYCSGNKKITCYLNLSLFDFYGYKPNRFIMIGNQLCLLNKIIDYSRGDSYTKCELLTINNLTNFIENDYQNEYIKLSRESDTVVAGSASNITVVGTGKWRVVNFLALGRNDIYITDKDGNNIYGGEFELTELDGYTVYDLIITTTLNTPSGEYIINFSTTGEYGDKYDFKFKLIVQ